MSDRWELGRLLAHACVSGETAEAKRLIAEGAPVDWQNEDGRAPLHYSSIFGYTEIVMLLLENKCKLNVTTESGDTPLIRAAEKNYMDIVRALVEAGCDITIRNKIGKTAAEWAKEKFHFATAEYLINEAPRVQAEIRADPSHREALRLRRLRRALGKELLIACRYGRTAEAKRLIAEGTPVDWQYGVGQAPLHVASMYGHTEIVMLLLKNKCNLNVTDKDGNTPLIYAAGNNKMDIVRALVEAGCDITIRGEDNKTAAEQAKQHTAIAEYLTNEAPRVQALLQTDLYNLARDGDNEKITDYFKHHQKKGRGPFFITRILQKFPISETAFGEGKLHSLSRASKGTPTQCVYCSSSERQ